MNLARIAKPASTVGRAKAVVRSTMPRYLRWTGGGAEVWFGDSLDRYAQWEAPDVIVSDGAYGVLGFEGDTSDHLGIPEWYEPHARAWAARAKLGTTLWFWNSEIGWAAAHPVLERHGFRYVNANVWNKGVAHIAGNVNTGRIRRFPVVTEVCVQYVMEPRIDGVILKHWLLREWKRAGLPLRAANAACGVADAATRKYFDQGHLWYWPPVDMFRRLVAYANEHGLAEGRPYFSLDGRHPMTDAEWATTRAKFRCPHGVTNVWERTALHGSERIAAPDGRAVHLNQKPLSLMTRIVEASSDPGDVVWEPFGGLFSATAAAMRLGRRAFAAEIDATYFQYGVERLAREEGQLASTGSSTVNVDPSPATLATVIRPPSASTMRRTIHSPSPKPP
jgi:site-specific DNA-methyltransferase (adenine-specific)